MKREWPDPFFIIGAPRSGTTYLQRVLNTHPDLYITHETRVMTWVNRALIDLPADDRTILAKKDLWLSMLHRELPMLVYRFYRRLGAEKNQRWGDKNPHYADPKIDPACLTTIDNLYPTSQFIHILRDGRSVAASLLAKGWALNVEYAIDVWRRHILHARAFGAQLGPDRYLEVKHEDLVADGEAVAKVCCEFLGVPMSSAVTDFLEQEARERSDISKPTSDLTSATPWEGRLTDEQLAKLEPAMADLLVELGYATQAWADALPPAPESATPVASSYTAEERAALPAFDVEGATPEDLAGRVKLLQDLVEDRNRQLTQMGQALADERASLEASKKRVEQLKARSAKNQARANELLSNPLIKLVWKARAAWMRLRAR